ncbi:hypothetical protein P171DRAFT_188371 [Karstenula rhodostoma CBS 690.94]|uniref:Uncharacterized protein n=1 Tax=Karstenula rhodostoma CBS 690.94 TaxID=1392251 RepID=A0A9P4UES7_9PLEO|nr:hypothetical protein P171DRAFT_188371 [Karstenula rhodostoma CBS 690.94]
MAPMSRAPSLCQLILRQSCMLTPNPLRTNPPSIPAINLARLQTPCPLLPGSNAGPASSHRSHLHPLPIASTRPPSSCRWMPPRLPRFVLSRQTPKGPLSLHARSTRCQHLPPGL